MTETKLRQSVVGIARHWEPIKRGSALHKEMLAVYNSHKPLPRNYAVQIKDAYCATFTSACWIQAGVASVTVIECSVPKMVTLAKSAGIWVENDAYTPKPGDAIVYDWEDDGVGDNTGYPDHVGIIEKVEGSYMYVLEGNMSGGSAGRRKIALNNKLIRGFVCPKFSSLATPEKTVTDIAREVINGLWGNGAERKRRLSAAGWDYKAVQAEVNRILKGDNPPKPIPARSFAFSAAGKYTTKAELTLRCGPGTGYTAIKTLPKGTVVRCYGFYTAVNGTCWLYVRAGDGTVGYADERLLK